MILKQNFIHNKTENRKKGKSYDKFDIEEFDNNYKAKHEKPDVEYQKGFKTPHEQLWHSVLLQQFKDAERLFSTKSENKNAAKRAIHWLWHDSEDFNEVCVLAGFDPSYTKLRVKLWLKKQYPTLLRGGWFVPPDIGTLKRRNKGD